MNAGDAGRCLRVDCLAELLVHGCSVSTVIWEMEVDGE